MNTEKKSLPVKASDVNNELVVSLGRTSIFDFHRLVLPTREGVALVSCKDILRCESDRSSCVFHMADGTAMRISKSLKFFELKLREWNFIRVHKSNMVNMRHIDKYVNTNGGSLILSDKSAVSVSIRKKPRVMKVLQVS